MYVSDVIVSVIVREVERVLLDLIFVSERQLIIVVAREDGSFPRS